MQLGPCAVLDQQRTSCLSKTTQNLLQCKSVFLSRNRNIASNVHTPPSPEGAGVESQQAPGMSSQSKIYILSQNKTFRKKATNIRSRRYSDSIKRISQINQSTTGKQLTTWHNKTSCSKTTRTQSASPSTSRSISICVIFTALEPKLRQVQTAHASWSSHTLRSALHRP